MVSHDMGLRSYYDAVLDLREAMTLRKPLGRWMARSADAVRRVRTYIPHDYDVHAAYERSKGSKRSQGSAHFLQRVCTLARMRKGFFPRDTPIWHSMAVVVEWCEQEIMCLCGTHLACVFKKHQQWERSAARRLRQWESQRKQRCAEARAVLGLRRAMTAARVKYARQCTRKRTRAATMLEREAALYAKWVRRNGWNILNRSQLFDALRQARPSEFKHALAIVEHYMPGVTATGQLDVMDWTNATCAHVYYEAFGLPRA